MLPANGLPVSGPQAGRLAAAKIACGSRDMEWMLAAGVILPDDIVYKIGRKIEARYM